MGYIGLKQVYSILCKSTKHILYVTGYAWPMKLTVSSQPASLIFIPWD